MIDKAVNWLNKRSGGGEAVSYTVPSVNLGLECVCVIVRSKVSL